MDKEQKKPKKFSLSKFSKKLQPDDPSTPSSSLNCTSSIPKSADVQSDWVEEEIQNAKIQLSKEKTEWQTANNAPTDSIVLPNPLLKDPDTLFYGSLKMRSLPAKEWIERFCILKPDQLLYFKNEKNFKYSGIICLHGTCITERPKKDGLSFKIKHERGHSIFSERGLKGEFLPSSANPLSCTCCVFRARNFQEKNQWLEWLQKAKKTDNSAGGNASSIETDLSQEQIDPNLPPLPTLVDPNNNNFFKNQNHSDHRDPNQNEIQNQFDHPIKLTSQDDIQHKAESHPIKSTSQDDIQHKAESNLITSQAKRKKYPTQQVGTPYTSFHLKDIYQQGETKEKIEGESSSLLIMILKQLRPGMDLTRVVLPTFILEPRSTLEKLSDYMAHGELLFPLPQLESPEQRIIQVAKWYLSGFYLKPEGCKKPYNPILGEYFRCRWDHGDNSYTHYIAEQVSHHPPISAFFCSNKKQGFFINGSIRFESKFYGTSAGSLLIGSMILHSIPFDEDYEITFPSAVAKGFVFGTLSMELVGKVSIIGKQTGYRVDLEFKEKPFFGGDVNILKGTVSYQHKILFTLHGKWDGEIRLVNTKNESTILWTPTEQIRKHRLPIQKPTAEAQGKFESNRLWEKVTQAILSKDQVAATQEKYYLEQAQRQAARLREATDVVWRPRLFHKQQNDRYLYNFMEGCTSLWQNSVDGYQYECDHGVIKVQPIFFEEEEADQQQIGQHSVQKEGQKQVVSSEQYEKLLLKISQLESTLKEVEKKPLWQDVKFILMFLIFLKLFIFS